MALLSLLILYNMEIDSFNINEDATALILTLTAATNVDTLYLWTDKTYKDYSLAIDLSSLLDGQANQTIEISLQTLNIPYFNGIYFVEVSDVNTVDNSFLTVLTKYKECILEKLSKLGLCSSCLKTESTPLLNAQSLLNGIEYAVEQGFIEEAKNLIKALDKYCSNDCKTCGKYSNITNNNYYDYN